jgi:hypothetical protein
MRRQRIRFKLFQSRGSIDGLGALPDIDASGRTAGSHLTMGEPCQQLSVHENALDAIERVTISAKKIEIRLSEPIRDKHVGLRRVMVLSAMSARTNADEAGHAKTRAAAAL